jgi:hypothetical protein
MKDRKTVLKLLGTAVMFFAACHLVINIYVAAMPLFAGRAEIQVMMRSLVRVFGPIAIQENRDPAILTVKITTSLLFLLSGAGIFLCKEVFRRLLLFLLVARIMYGATVSIVRYLHPHLWIIIAVGVILFYYLTRPGVKAQFK